MLRFAGQSRLRSFTAIRSFASNPFPPSNDQKLNNLLGTIEENISTAPLWKASPSAPAFPEDVDTDPALADPPKAPDGSLPAPSPQSPSSSRTKKATSAHKIEERHYYLHVFASRNNTILTLSDMLHNPCHWVSAGLCGFKKVQRSGYEAGYQCAVRMFKRIEEIKNADHKVFKLGIAFSGYGFGREAVFRALMASEGDGVRNTVAMVKDVTKLKIGGGTKARKMRRL